jgi:ribosomal-protein-alanine N-acetyltransferase
MSVSQGRLWPVELREGTVTLRPMRRRDARRWRAVRAANADWLAPWEATNPDPAGIAPTYGGMIRSFNREARAGRMLPFAVDLDGGLVGQLTVSGLTGGSLRSGQVGYWVDRRVAGRGVIPSAVAMSVDHCFFTLGMHRMEVNIRPENRASLRVVEKLGFRPEGLRKRYLHIDGAWRDHLTFALTVEDIPGGLLPRWRALAADLAEERADRAAVARSLDRAAGIGGVGGVCLTEPQRSGHDRLRSCDGQAATLGRDLGSDCCRPGEMDTLAAGEGASWLKDAVSGRQSDEWPVGREVEYGM